MKSVTRFHSFDGIPDPTANGGRRLTGEQVAAIKRAAELGHSIRWSLPEIADEYRNGLTAPRLALRHEIGLRYGVGRKIATDAIRNAIRGYAGPYHEPYEGLISDPLERQSLATAHNKQTGIELYERKGGIHALTHEQRVTAGRKGGLVRGPLTYRLRIGCHALPPELLREHCRKIASLGGKAGARASVLARGLTPYAPAEAGRIAEIDFVLRLASDPRYQDPVRRNFRKMARELNEVFQGGAEFYTRTTLKITLQSYRRRVRSESNWAPDIEISFAEELASDPSYQLPARVRGKDVARMVNAEYHGGKPVRDSFSICGVISRYRRQHGTSTTGCL